MTRVKIQDLEGVAATRAKVNFGDILYQASVHGRRFVVNRQGKPVVVIIGYREYLSMVGKEAEDLGADELDEGSLTGRV